ncbi:MAG: phosphoribosyltransferase family protein [bacterium]|nr:phosphoribosyltransferase family protein [bacterium]
MTQVLNKILTERQVRDKITRIAYEIYENNFQNEELVLVGINGQGYTLAKLLKQTLDNISDINISIAELSIDKENHLSKPVAIDTDEANLLDKAIVLVDDVQNSGRTISHGLGFLLKNGVKKIETAVLVDRSHKSFPILANYMGYEIATMIDEYIDVQLDGEIGVFLHS